MPLYQTKYILDINPTAISRLLLLHLIYVANIKTKSQMPLRTYTLTTFLRPCAIPPLHPLWQVFINSLSFLNVQTLLIKSMVSYFPSIFFPDNCLEIILTDLSLWSLLAGLCFRLLKQPRSSDCSSCGCCHFSLSLGTVQVYHCYSWRRNGHKLCFLSFKGLSHQEYSPMFFFFGLWN